jgi:hypothetical protein
VLPSRAPNRLFCNALIRIQVDGGGYELVFSARFAGAQFASIIDGQRYRGRDPVRRLATRESKMFRQTIVAVGLSEIFSKKFDNPFGYGHSMLPLSPPPQ